MIESLLGPTVGKLYEFCNNNFDIITKCNISIDLLNSFEILYNNGYLFMNTKRDNIAILLSNIKN